MQKDIHMLFLGDSLIADFPWSERLLNCTTEEIGIPGATAQSILELLPSLNFQNEPDIVMVMLGTNNLYQGDYNFVPTLKNVVQQLNLSFPQAEILITTLLPMKLDHLAPETITMVNDELNEMATKTGCCLLDMHSQFVNLPTETVFLPDNIHLTTTAYELWCKNLLEHIAFLIESD